MEVLPDPYIKKGYGHLRRFAEFHLTEHEFTTHAEMEAAATAAQLELLEYAKLAEMVGSGQGATSRPLACCPQQQLAHHYPLQPPLSSPPPPPTNKGLQPIRRHCQLPQ
jgi:hypothetical protein